MTDADVRLLAAETLEFLRTRPSSESPIPGWRLVSGFDAGVNRWWVQQINSPIPSDTGVRLRKMRAQMYDFLDEELGLISKAPGQNAPIHLAPIGEVLPRGEVEGAPKDVHIGPGGAGFGDAAKNRAVELAAMRETVFHFAGWTSVDVSAQKVGWDITFSREGEEIHVEVKGVSDRQPSVLLTRNEVNVAAEDPRWLLVVVTQALVAPVVHTFDRAAVVDAATPYVYRADFGVA